MGEKVYFEFLAVIQGEGPTYFLIELDKYDSVTGKESDNPKLRAEDFITLLHLDRVQRTEGPIRVFEDYVAKLHKMGIIATHRDGKVWIVQKPWLPFPLLPERLSPAFSGLRYECLIARSNMVTCFVIQPFDAGKFDGRYKDTFKPAIEAAGFEAYRVDKDPSVSIPIEQIEKGIRKRSYASRITWAKEEGRSAVHYERDFLCAQGTPRVVSVISWSMYWVWSWP
jgi:hypothetical protein